MRKTLVPPQGGTKAPYVLGLNRCSCGVTPFAVPSLPPCTCGASIAGADSPYSWGHPQQGSPSQPTGTAGAFGEGVVCRAGPDSTWSQKPLSRCAPAHVRLLSFLCRDFCYASTFILGTGGKRGFKILFNSSWVFFHIIFCPVMSSRRERFSVDMEGRFLPP